jgi:hypothetical protein
LNGDACRSSLLLVLLGLVLLLFYGGVKVEFLGIVELSRKIRVEAGLVGLVGQLVFAQSWSLVGLGMGVGVALAVNSSH